jgi:N-acetylmuramoyl-L-alanine amidase
MLQQFTNLIFSMLMAVTGDQSSNINIEKVQDTACLSQAIYQEAGNQSMAGKLAVGNVINNRTKSDYYPDTMCAVIKQKGQFSFWKNVHRIKESDPAVMKQMEDSVKAALLVVNGETRDNTNGATAFVNLKIATHKEWLRNMKFTAKIGEHHFYKNLH